MHLAWRMRLTRYSPRHEKMDGCLAELKRKPALRKGVGIEQGRAVPDSWNMGRFLAVLGQRPRPRLMRRMFPRLIGRLSQATLGLGQHVAGDSVARSARATWF